jgi:hypothetical protein
MSRILRMTFASVAMATLLPLLILAADDTFTLPAGTTLHVTLTTTLSSRSSEVGDPWTGRVEEPIFAKGEEIIPAGSTVKGRVTFVKTPGRAKGLAEMRLVAETISTPDHVKYAIVANLEEAQGAEGAKVTGKEGTVEGPGKSKKGQAVETGIGAGAGAAVGAIAAGGKGSLYGAGIGALVAAIHGLSKRHKDVTLPPGTELTFELTRPTTARRVSSPANSQAQ